MIKQKFGWANVEVPIIGQGTWLIESNGGIDRRNNNSQLAIKTLQMGLDLGMTHIDTAEMYGNGRAEELVGEAISAVKREEVFLASKVLSSNTSYDVAFAILYV
jgi:aryl-alcohol dehydrogenase-like predicted oxidoreductase